MKHRIVHTEKWFKNRVNKFVMNRKTKELIRIEDDEHANLLYVWQDTGKEFIEVRKTKIK